jgi:hypothetical protein
MMMNPLSRSLPLCHQQLPHDLCNIKPKGIQAKIERIAFKLSFLSFRLVCVLCHEEQE